MMNQFLNELENALSYIESSTVKEAMNYSLQAGGKRIRPVCVMEMCVACNEKIDKAIPVAIALEMIHTYSLIHDDLPAMDNDDLRRGRPTCHKQFDEATAILAGDGLLTESFGLVTKSKLTDSQKLKCIEVLVECAGANGMILGQTLDMDAEVNTIENVEDLKRVHINKTGKLFSAAFRLGAIVANKSDILKDLDEIGLKMGVAFQIQDDVLDSTQTAVDLGKSNSDAVNHKTTYVTLMGIENAKQAMDEAYDEVISLIEKLPIHVSGIKALVEGMRIRLK